MTDIIEKLENKQFQEVKKELETLNIPDIAGMFEKLEGENQNGKQVP